MKKLLCILFLMSSFVVNASTMVVWTCEMLEGDEMEDVKKINTAWVIAVNKLSESKVQSYVLEPIASSQMESFRYIDIYENPVHWGQIRSRMDDGALDTFENQFDEVSKCTEASLYQAESS